MACKAGLNDGRVNFREMQMPLVTGYLDPGTGSLLLQALVGGFAGMWVFMRFVWNRFRQGSPASGLNAVQEDSGSDKEPLVPGSPDSRLKDTE